MQVVQTSIQAKFREVLAKLRNEVAEIQAVLLVGPDGVVLKRYAPTDTPASIGADLKSLLP